MTAVIGELAWLLSTVLASGPDGTGMVGSALNAVITGILGNEAHRLYRDRVAPALSNLNGLSGPENHDLARAVRIAHAKALTVQLANYRMLHETAWRAAPTSRPALFLDRLDVACADMRSVCLAKTFLFDTAVTDTMQASFEALLSEPVLDGPAALRADALAGFTEEAVLAELRAALHGVPIPADFEVLFHHGGQGRPRFLDVFGKAFSEQITTHGPVRDILTTRVLARIEGLSFDASEILDRIEKRFGAKLDAILGRQAKEAEVGARRHAELKRLLIDAAGAGASSVQAIAEIRDLLRPGNPDIDGIEANRLPGLVQLILEQLAQPTAIDEGFSGAVKRALAEAQARVSELAFSDAAQVLDEQLARIEAEDRDRGRGRAALLSERGRVASLQLQYRDSAGFHRLAAEAVGFDSAAAWSHLLAAADVLCDQGVEFGDNPALLAAIGAYQAALAIVPQPGRSEEWATTQNNMGNALSIFGERETGIGQLEDAVAAYHAALTVRTRQRTPLGWARTQNNLGNVLEALGKRGAGKPCLEQAVAAYRAALEELPRARAPLEWAMIQNNIGVGLTTLGGLERGTKRLKEAIGAFLAALLERTRERVPLLWAMTQSNLGNVLRTVGERENDLSSLYDAVVAHRLALAGCGKTLPRTGCDLILLAHWWRRMMARCAGKIGRRQSCSAT